MITVADIRGFEEIAPGLRCHCGLLYNEEGFLITTNNGTFWFCSVACIKNLVDVKVDWKQEGF